MKAQFLLIAYLFPLPIYGCGENFFKEALDHGYLGSCAKPSVPDVIIPAPGVANTSVASVIPGCIEPVNEQEPKYVIAHTELLDESPTIISMLRENVNQIGAEKSLPPEMQFAEKILELLHQLKITPALPRLPSTPPASPRLQRRDGRRDDEHDDKCHDEVILEFEISKLISFKVKGKQAQAVSTVEKIMNLIPLKELLGCVPPLVSVKA